MSELPKPGDLAYIVRDSLFCQENIGAVVLVSPDQTTPVGYYPAEPGEVWISSTRTLAGMNGLTKLYAEPGEPLTIPLGFLRKIAGPGSCDELLQAEPEGVAA